MILEATPDGTIAILQSDHAAFAAFLLEHWSSHNFMHDPQRAEIIRAAREHDNGWIGFELVRDLDPRTRLPRPFSDVTPDEAAHVWRRGTQTHIAGDPFIALLITHHAYTIHENVHKGDPEWKGFFTEFARQRAELRDALGLDHPAIERAYSYLRMADWFSLRFCMSYDLGAETPERYAGYQFRRVDTRLLFKPYPFDARELRYELPFYRLDARGYDTMEAARAAFNTGESMTIFVEPLGKDAR